MGGGVSKDQLKRARQVDILDYILTHEPDNIHRVGHEYRLRDHPSLTVNSGKWFWHSQDFGGKTALDYLTKVRGIGLVDAVCNLLNETPVVQSKKDIQRNITPSPPQRSLSTVARCLPERKPFIKPPRHSDNRRVTAYLLSRGIDRDLIRDCIAQGIVYENTLYHNAVFVGRDEHGKTLFAAMRGTLDSFRRDADGSDKKYGFTLPASNLNSREAAIFESPIDCLSHQTLCNHGSIPPFDGWRLSLGGTSLVALTHFLKHHSDVTDCLICTDNDTAGNLAADKIAEVPGITTTRAPPMHGKDWNDTLQNILKTERLKNRVRQSDMPCL